MKSKVAAIIANPGRAIQDALLAKKHGADILEFRIDLLSTSSQATIKLIKSAKKKTKLPVIGTIRLKSEGGEFKKNEKARLEFFRQIIPHVNYIDIELSSKILAKVINFAKKKGGKVIISYHNFRCTPDTNTLKKIVNKSRGLAPDIIKIASNIKKPDDFRRLAAILVEYYRIPISIIPMSKKPAFKAFRLISLALGSALSYSFIKKSIAPGQISLKEQTEFLKQSSI
jgi:3-dehydroquinate dehydratase-1